MALGPEHLRQTGGGNGLVVEFRKEFVWRVAEFLPEQLFDFVWLAWQALVLAFEKTKSHVVDHMARSGNGM